MTTDKPYVLLARTYSEQDEIHHLQVITYLDQTNFVADGHLAIPTAVNSDGKFAFTLKVKQDTSLPIFKLSTPVVHVVTLTGTRLTAENPLLEITVEDATGTTIGKTTVHRDDADEDLLPTPRR